MLAHVPIYGSTADILAVISIRFSSLILDTLIQHIHTPLAEFNAIHFVNFVRAPGSGGRQQRLHCY